MPAINPLPTPPSRNDPANFSDRADAFLAALPAYTNEANALLDDVHTSRDTVQGLRDEVMAAGLANAATNAATATTKAAEASASAAEAFGYLQAYRATSYGALASDPVVDPNGNPPTVGDEYFNTTMNLLKRFNGVTWQASDIATADLAAPGGSTLVGYDGGTAQDVLDDAKPIANYTALRAYTGRATGVRITQSGLAGFFQRDDADATSADNGGTIIVDASGRRWRRLFDGSVSVKWFGAKGDAVTDDTVPVHAAIDYAKGMRGSVFFPSGTYRVTSGYTQNIAQNDIYLFGEGSTREVFPGNPSKGSRILLDSTDPASFFYKSIANHNLQVDGLTFSSAQFVQDRSFFNLGANTSQFFTRVNFESVERPIVWPAGAYFQNAAYRDVQFRNSGTFHSETASLIGTLLVLDNVNHEGSIPANTEKVGCNLSGVRQIQGTNVLLEGSSPGAGWTILKLGTTYDNDWVAESVANFDGLWIEFSGTPFNYCVEQVRGKVAIKNANSFITATNKYRLTEKACLELDATGFAGAAFDPATAFSLDSLNCTVVLKNCGIRLTRQLVQQRFFYDDCYVASSDNNVSMARFSSTAPELLYAYDGKPFDSALVSSYVSGGTVFRQETDATYGRKLSVYPASNSIDAAVRANSFNSFTIGDQFFIKVKAKLPAFTGNQIQFRASSNAAVLAAYAFTAAEYSGQVVTLTIPFRLIAAANSVGLSLNTVGVTSISDPIEIYHLEIYRGGNFPNGYRTAYPSRIEFYATAAPVNGTWAVGDRAYNSAPVIGQPKSWVCTVAGTPGTWVSEGNL